MKCDNYLDGKCRVGMELAGCDVLPSKEECEACSRTEKPMQLNYIVASIAYRSVPTKENLDTWTNLGYFLLGRKDSGLVLTEGVGTELHAILKEKGWEVKQGCKCLPTIFQMNKEGVEWCKKNIVKITDVMIDEWHRLHPTASIYTPNWLLEYGSTNIVKEAIKRYEQKQEGKAEANL